MHAILVECAVTNNRICRQNSENVCGKTEKTCTWMRRQKSRAQESKTSERRGWLENMKFVENKSMVCAKSDEMRVTRTEEVLEMLNDNGRVCNGKKLAV